MNRFDSSAPRILTYRLLTGCRLLIAPRILCLLQLSANKDEWRTEPLWNHVQQPDCLNNNNRAWTRVVWTSQLTTITGFVTLGTTRQALLYSSAICDIFID
jgi:hypothetical protein